LCASRMTTDAPLRNSHPVQIPFRFFPLLEILLEVGEGGEFPLSTEAVDSAPSFFAPSEWHQQVHSTQEHVSCLATEAWHIGLINANGRAQLSEALI
jgi:hypothetical protein